ncbi:hypothetical protein [Arthrobacter sp. MMS18-M83]|uniref:hypothetical protein n=1 Tax=Arthrobacter sp. MMS18-M83 TaxID=2996261 RepID=UPI00227AAB87|nr:hypothetical protein [Arthrobacter sp. MMS18-M83]WAH97589.1 hypothetical protein OW521_01410 [Arthrobacter sp. MMS18-M83]
MAGCSGPEPSAIVGSGGAESHASGSIIASQAGVQPASGLILTWTDSSGNAEVDAIDPATGAAGTVATFVSPDTSISIDPEIVEMTYGSSPMGRAMFSPDFHRVVAVKKTSAAAVHVGWLDTTGTFTDVSAATNTTSGSATVTADDTPMFGTDGTFYFARREAGVGPKKQPTIVKVPNGLTGPATAMKTLSPDEGVNYFVNPDGTLVGVQYGGGTFQENGAGVGGFVVQDWINSTEYVAVDFSQSGIYRVKAKPRSKSDLMDSPTDGIALFQPTDRTPSYTVVSPDGASVAFLSMAPNSGSHELYTVGSAGGGTPKKVPASAVPNKAKLIGWK